MSNLEDSVNIFLTFCGSNGDVIVNDHQIDGIRREGINSNGCAYI